MGMAESVPLRLPLAEPVKGVENLTLFAAVQKQARADGSWEARPCAVQGSGDFLLAWGTPVVPARLHGWDRPIDEASAPSGQVAANPFGELCGVHLRPRALVVSWNRHPAAGPEVALGLLRGDCDCFRSLSGISGEVF